MKEVIVDCLGYNDQSFKLPVLYYESFDEADKAAGKAGAMLQEGNLNLDYRGARADGRDLIVEVVQELTGVSVKQKDTDEKDDKGQPIMEDDETEAKFVKRAMALKPEVTVAAVQAILDKRARGYSYKDEKGVVVQVPAIAVDITQKTRQPKKPVKLAAKYLEKAKAILAGPNLKKFLADLKKNLSVDWVASGDATKDADSLGWQVKAFAAWKEQQALDSMG